MGNILRKGVQVLQQYAGKETKIYRVSENIFYFWLTEPVQLKETMDELITRCEKMRLLDEKHADVSFIEGKMKLL